MNETNNLTEMGIDERTKREIAAIAKKYTLAVENCRRQESVIYYDIYLTDGHGSECLVYREKPDPDFWRARLANVVQGILTRETER